MGHDSAANGSLSFPGSHICSVKGSVGAKLLSASNHDGIIVWSLYPANSSTEIDIWYAVDNINTYVVTSHRH